MSDVVTVTYRPTEDEPYMNKDQQEYFRRKLISWREEILRGSNETLRQLKEEDNRVADMSDWASFETERNFQLRARDRERKLIRAAIEGNGLQSLDEIQAIIDRTGALEYTAARAQEAADSAIDALGGVPDSEHRAALVAIAELAVKRRS